MITILGVLNWRDITNAALGGIATGALVACNYRINEKIRKKSGFGPNVSFRSLVALLFSIFVGLVVAGLIIVIMLHTAFRQNGNIVETAAFFVSGVAIFVYAARRKFMQNRAC